MNEWTPFKGGCLERRNDLRSSQSEGPGENVQSNGNLQMEGLFLMNLNRWMSDVFSERLNRWRLLQGFGLTLLRSARFLLAKDGLNRSVQIREDHPLIVKRDLELFRDLININ